MSVPTPRAGRLGPVRPWTQLWEGDIWQRSLPDSWGVRIHRGLVPSTLPGAVTISPFLSLSTDAALVTYLDQAQLFITSDEVRLQELAALTEQDRQYLIYSWGGRLVRTLRHQFSLHASSVLTAGGAVAVLGRSRAGKSSTLLGLREVGYPVIADDLTSADLVGNDRVQTTAWRRPIHVRQPTADQFGIDESFPRISASLRADRPYLASNDIHGSQAYPLQLLVQLIPDARVTGVEVESLVGMQKLMVIKANIDRLGQSTGAGRDEPFFRWASAVADRVPMVALRRPTQGWSLPQVVAAITELADPPPASVDLTELRPQLQTTVGL